MKNCIYTIVISLFVISGASPVLAAASNTLHSQQIFLKSLTEHQCSSGNSCMITKIKSVQVQLPFCANAVNAICEKRARTRCEGVEPKEKYNQCIEFETKECELDERCRN